MAAIRWWLIGARQFSHLSQAKTLMCCKSTECLAYSLHTDSLNCSSQAVQPLSPAVRYLVDSNDIDVAQLKPTGPKNRLLKGDVLQYLSDSTRSISSSVEVDKPVKPAIPDRSESFTDIPLTSMRKTIAKRLTLSKTTIPYSYSVIDCKMDNVLRFREEILKEKEVKVSMNDFVVKAAALSLRRVPECNASWVSESVQVHPTVDVSVAVATEGGLITPIIKNADELKLTELSSQIRTLAKKARDGKLQPHEYQGGTFSVSNFGMFGIREFTAIINPPQAAILAVGGVSSVPWVSSEAEEGVATLMTATLSHDCRVIDYELAAQWLTVFRNLLESPSILDIL